MAEGVGLPGADGAEGGTPEDAHQLRDRWPRGGARGQRPDD